MTPECPHASALADLLERQREPIIHRWAERVRAEVTAELSAPELRNRLPDFLDQVAAALRQGPLTVDVAREHGRQRYRVGFDLRTLVIEYNILREVLFDSITESGVVVHVADIKVLCAAFARGVTEAVDQYSQERDADQRARAAERERASEFERQLIAIVSHDLRSPLAAILLAAEAAVRRVDVTHPVARLLVRIRTGAQRATRLINDLLDFTHERKSGRIPVKPQEVSLRTLVREAVEEAAAMSPGRIIEYACEDPILVRVDPDRVAQVLSNLLANALKFSPSSSVVRVSTRVEPASDAAVIEVHNWGPPIPADQRGAIFEPFQRGDASTDARASLGLGLHISRQIVLAHGGTIDVCSSAEAGTTFTCTLPRRSPLVPHADAS